jgi:acyl-CoA synthetase (NDP forming)
MLSRHQCRFCVIDIKAIALLSFACFRYTIVKGFSIVGIAQIIATARSQNRLVLTEVEAKEIMQSAGVPVVKTILAKTKNEALQLSEQIGFPIVAKIVAPDITHKSDAGGVRMNISDRVQMEQAWDDLMSNAQAAFPNSQIDGVAVQPQAPEGTEVIIGGSQDPQFGPIVMFGLGGVFVEILKDVSFRIVPLSDNDASEMITDIKSYKVLEGYRGNAAADTSAIQKALVATSTLLETNPDIAELDLNPVFAYSDGILAVDARIILKDQS